MLLRGYTEREGQGYIEGRGPLGRGAAGRLLGGWVVPRGLLLDGREVVLVLLVLHLGRRLRVRHGVLHGRRTLRLVLRYILCRCPGRRLVPGLEHRGHWHRQGLEVPVCWVRGVCLARLRGAVCGLRGGCANWAVRDLVAKEVALRAVVADVPACRGKGCP